MKSLDPLPTHARIARTPLDQWHSQHGAQFIDCDGWRLPATYNGVQLDIAAAMSGVGLVDISALAKVRLVGPGIPAALERFSGNALSKPGNVSVIDGTDRSIACRLTSDQLLLLGTTPRVADLQSLVSLGHDLPIEQQDVTCGLAGVHLIGPQVDGLLRRVMSFDIVQRSFPVGSCAETGCAGVHVTVIRDAVLEIPAVRLYVSWDFGEYVWERLLDAGRSLSITPVGVEAWRLLAKVNSN